MKAKSQKHNWIVDVILVIGFLIAFLLDVTGLAWHQLLGRFVVAPFRKRDLLGDRDWFSLYPKIHHNITVPPRFYS